MIFKSVSNLNTKTEKTFFLEQINVYIRLTEVFIEKYNKSMDGILNEPNIEELQSIGVIENEREIDELKKVLGIQYNEFIKAVNFAVANRDEMGDILDKLSNKERQLLQQKAARKKKYTMVDFFCGAGGLSLGFIQKGFTVKLANDIEDVCIETYKYNHPELPSDKLIQGDIKEIVDNIDDYVTQEIDIVVGGPPCQGFSEANRQRVIDDPRNKLYKYFVKAVEKIEPKFVVMENVKGMLKVADQVVEDYGKLRVKDGCSYLVAYRLLNSQDFSVAQSRERLIYIAIRSDIAEEKNITPDEIFDLIEKSCKNHKTFNLADALNDIKPLDAPRIKNMNEVDSETTGKKIDVNYDDQNNNEYLRLINMGRKMALLT